MTARGVFFVGPGYSGREVIDLLLADGSYNITALVRRKEAAEELRSCGIKTVLGDLEDSETITKYAAESDIVFHLATADHLGSVKAILKGVEQRASKGLQTIYLHQSGTGVLSDGSAGNSSPTTTFSDDRPDDMDALSDDAPHRSIDLAILAARQQFKDHARIFIVLPPIIYGVNPKYDRQSIQVPALTRFAIKHGYAGHVGKGVSRWSTVHVLDLAKAYQIILDWASDTGLTKTDSANPYFFVENGDITWYDVAALIGQNLQRVGKISDASPKTIPEAQYGDMFGPGTPIVVGCNSMSKAERVRRLGWSAEQPSLVDGFADQELRAILLE